MFRGSLLNTTFDRNSNVAALGPYGVTAAEVTGTDECDSNFYRNEDCAPHRESCAQRRDDEHYQSDSKGSEHLSQSTRQVDDAIPKNESRFLQRLFRGARDRESRRYHTHPARSCPATAGRAIKPAPACSVCFKGFGRADT